VNEEVLIGQCLNGERDRDCEYCPAHSSRRGGCCFGLRHEYGDPDCLACVLENECEALAHGVAKRDMRAAYSTPRIIHPSRPAAKAPIRTFVAPGTQPRQGAQRVAVMQDYGPQPGEPLLIQQPIQPEPLQLNPTTSLFKRFLVVGSWGAGEGFFEMALNFFRKRRPE
jgi:hypothetical protein